MRPSGIEIARSLDGKQEIRDREELRAFFKRYANHGDIDINPAETAWCSAFINACERASGALTEGKLNARSWLDYGVSVTLENAIEGDIVVFERGSNGYSGHVSYFVSYDKEKNLIFVFGGNQSDQVKLSGYAADRLLGIRRG